MKGEYSAQNIQSGSLLVATYLDVVGTLNKKEKENQDINLDKAESM